MRNLALSLLTVSTVACLAHDDEANQIASNLDATNGGETTADEAPLFGEEPDFDAMAIEKDAAIDDSMSTDTTVAAMVARPDIDSRRVLVAWGKLPMDPTATDVRDWSGSLALSRGAMLVGRTVGFEPATDRVLPRQSRDVVAFASVTKPFADGLVLRVVAEPGSTDPLTLTYTSATDSTITYTLDLAQLATGPIAIDAGNGYKMVAVALRDHDACHHGFMRGRWHQVRANLGVYRGIVHDADGTPIGHVRGIYGQRASGEKVMFGKFIDRDGKFNGIIVGTYDNGEFRAKWLDRAGDHGKLHGHYFEGANDRGGGFVARWAESTCTED
jgi:hypothetical protein